jgi:hypothetical protein
VKYVIPFLTLALAAGGIGVWLISDHQLLGLGMTGLSLVLWALAPSALGQAGGRTVARTDSVEKTDPQSVKQYRSKNPGATISDGLRARR